MQSPFACRLMMFDQEGGVDHQGSDGQWHSMQIVHRKHHHSGTQWVVGQTGTGWLSMFLPDLWNKSVIQWVNSLCSGFGIRWQRNLHRVGTLLEVKKQLGTHGVEDDTLHQYYQTLAWTIWFSISARCSQRRFPALGGAHLLP